MPTGSSSAQMSDQFFSTPNGALWPLFAALRRICVQPPSEDRSTIEQDGLIAIFLSITIIEAFTNVFFQVVAHEEQFAHAKARILKDLTRRGLPTGVKIVEWSQQAFGAEVNQRDPRWQRYEKMRDHRNELTHFRSSFSTIAVPDNVFIKGLADMSAFRRITANTPVEAMACVIGIAELIVTARGVRPEGLSGHVQHWLGAIPDEIERARSLDSC